MPEGETIQDVWERSVQSWNAIANGLDSAETALVVASDAVNKTILCHLLGLTPADIWAVKQGNGGVTVVELPTGRASAVVACLNLTSHLGGSRRTAVERSRESEPMTEMLLLDPIQVLQGPGHAVEIGGAALFEMAGWKHSATRRGGWSCSGLTAQDAAPIARALPVDAHSFLPNRFKARGASTA